MGAGLNFPRPADRRKEDLSGARVIHPATENRLKSSGSTTAELERGWMGQVRFVAAEAKRILEDECQSLRRAHDSPTPEFIGTLNSPIPVVG